MVCGQAPAQLVAAFDRAAAAYASAPADERGDRARLLSNAFLMLPSGRERQARLALGAEATLAAGRWEHALRICTLPLGTPDPPRLAAVRLQALIRLGRLSEAAALVAKHRHSRPGVLAPALRAEERALLPLAAAALRTADQGAGRLMFEELARLAPVQPYRLTNLALCLRQIGEVDAARRVYEAARELAPDDLEVWNDYGLFLRANGRHAEALRAFERSVTLDLDRAAAERAKGPGITNLMHLEALAPGSAGRDPVPVATEALAQRPQATMLRRLMLDVVLGRCAHR